MTPEVNKHVMRRFTQFLNTASRIVRGKSCEELPMPPDQGLTRRKSLSLNLAGTTWEGTRMFARGPAKGLAANTQPVRIVFDDNSNAAGYGIVAFAMPADQLLGQATLDT